MRDSVKDTTAPQIKGVTNNQEIQLSDTVTKVTLSSDDNDIDTIELKKDNTKVDSYRALGDITDAGNYVLTVKDKSGNKTVLNFTIKAKK